MYRCKVADASLIGKAMILKNLGKVLRELREGRRQSLRSLAEESGFSAAFLSQVENGQASPSLSSLKRIANALGVPLGEFFRATDELEGSSVIRVNERAGLNSEWSRAQIEVLGVIRPGRRIEGIIVTLAPDGASGTKPYHQNHEQIAFVVHGELELTLDDGVHILSAGDAATIAAGVHHLWRNISDASAQVLIVSSC